MRKMKYIDEIKHAAKDVGYYSCSFTQIEEIVATERYILERIKTFPNSKPIYSPVLRITREAKKVSWARSVIVCVRRYGKYTIPGNIDRYIARHYLFHRSNPHNPDRDMPTRFIEKVARIGVRIQNYYLPSRWLAYKAGLVFLGKNTFAYAGCGSWISIEIFLCEKELSELCETVKSKCPQNCRRCIDACPTQALVKPHTINPCLCISYLTWGSCTKEYVNRYANKMKQWIYGCDECQLACPLNKNKWESIENAGWLDQVSPHIDPGVLATINKDMFEKFILPNFWQIPKEALDRWHRNARRAIKNGSIQ